MESSREALLISVFSIKIKKGLPASIMSKNAPASNSRIALKLKALLKEWDSRGGRRRDSGVIAAEIDLC